MTESRCWSRRMRTIPERPLSPSSIPTLNPLMSGTALVAPASLRAADVASTSAATITLRSCWMSRFDMNIPPKRTTNRCRKLSYYQTVLQQRRFLFFPYYGNVGADFKLPHQGGLYLEQPRTRWPRETLPFCAPTAFYRRRQNRH